MRPLILAVLALALVPADAARAQVGFERRPTLAAPDEHAQADAIVSRLDAAAGVVRRQLDAARQARDVVRVLCLNDKLGQLDVAKRTALDRQGDLQTAEGRGDRELAHHEFVILTFLRQRAEQLVAEASQCLGEDLAFTGQAIVTMTAPPGLPDGVTEPPTDLGGLGEPPPPLSAGSTP